MTRYQYPFVTILKTFFVFVFSFLLVQLGMASRYEESAFDKTMVPDFSRTSEDTTICSGDSALIFVEATSALDSVFIKNSISGDTISRSLDSTGIFVRVAGDYELIVSDNVASTTKIVTITTSTPVAVISSGDLVTVCFDSDSVLLDASLSSGGIPLPGVPYSFTWSSANSNLVLNGQNSNDLTIKQVVESRPTVDQVFLTIQDAVGCTATDSISVVWDEEIDIEFSDRFLFFCEGEMGTSTAFVNGSGTVGNFTWDILRGSAIFTISPGTETISVTDGADGSEIEASAFNVAGCRFKDTLTVRKGRLDVNLSVSDTLVCIDEIVNLNVTIDSFPNTVYSYLWKINGVDYSTAKDTVLPVVENSAIEIIVTDEALNCPFERQSNVNISVPVARAGLSGNDTVRICEDVFITSVGSSLSSSGTPFTSGAPYLYSWVSPNAGLSLTNNSLEEVIVENVLEQNNFIGKVELTIQDRLGCESTDSIWLEWNNQFRLNILEDTVLFCDGEEDTISVLDNGLGTFSNYQWNRISGSSASFTVVADTSIVVSEATEALITVVAEDEFGCPSNVDTVFVDDILLNATITPVPDFYCVNETVSLNVELDSVSGNTYSYEWFIDDVSFDVQKSTFYTVNSDVVAKITIEDDVLGCTSSDSVSLMISVPVASVGLEDTVRVCRGIYEPQVNASASFGGRTFSQGARYSYLWSTVDTNLNIASASSEISSISNVNERDVFIGRVDLMVTDSIGCSSNDSLWLEWDNSFMLNIPEDSLLFCDGEQDTISVLDNGRGVFSNYQWNRISGSSASFTVVADTSIVVSEATESIITVVAEDEFGCPSNVDTVFVNNVLLNALINPVSTFNCVESIVSLGITFDSVPRNTYTYEWLIDDSFYSNRTDTLFEIVQNNEVKIVLTDNILGCQSTDSINLQISVPMANAGIIDTIDVCSNVFTSGANAILSSGGVPFNNSFPYLYSWRTSNPNLSVEDPSSQTVSVTNVNELDFLLGKVDLEITDSIGCTSMDSIWFRWEALKDVVINKDTVLFCDGVMDSVVANLSGSGDFSSYVWSAGSGGGATFTQSDSVAVFLSANNAYVSVLATDGEGCTFTDSAFVNSESLTNVISEPLNKACLGDTINLSTDHNTYTSGEYSYEWLIDNVPYSVARDTLYAFSGNVLITAEVTDSIYGCFSKDSITVLSSVPVAVIADGATDTLVSCFSDSSILLSANSSTAGTLPYSYLWNTPDRARVTLANENSVNAVLSNTSSLESDFTLVFLQIIDSIGCESVDSIVVEWQEEIQVNPSVSSLVCNSINDTISISPNMEMLSILWSPDVLLNTISGNTDDTLVYNPNGATGTSIINLTVENSNGCLKDTSIVLNLQDLSLELSTISTDVCSSVAVPFMAKQTGGSTELTYIWDGINGVLNDSLNTYQFTADSLIKVSVLDPNTGCAAMDSLEITINELIVTASSSSDSVCFNENATLSINNVSGGSGGNIFSWSGGETVGQEQDSISVRPIILGLSNTTEYVLTAEDTLGCLAYDTLSISRNNEILSALNTSDSLCSDSVIVLGNPSGNAIGGSGSFNYEWTTTNGSLSTASGTQTVFTPINNTSNASVFLEIIDSVLTKCSTQEIISLKVEGHAPLTLDDTVSICLFDSTVLNPNLNNVNGLSYLWSNSSTSDSIIANDTITYYVTATSLLGCVSFDSTRIAFLVPDEISLVGDTNSICAYDSAKFNVLGAENGTVNWTVVNAQQMVINDTLTLRDSVGLGLNPVVVTMNFKNICTDTSVTFDFEFYDVPQADFITSVSEIQQQQPFSLLDASSNAGNATYSWLVETNTTSVTSSEKDVTGLTIPELGFYNATLILVDDSTGCTDSISRSFEIIEAENLIFIPSAFNPNAVNEENRVIKVYGTNLATEDFQFEIFNRWGASVYKTSSLLEAQSLGWDGNVEENNITVFTYTLVAKYTDGTQINKTGNITLIE